ncbi:MAG: 2-succinyl-5-enolpyruvyl-6-hydroxy-3-cyclohexene-1-carboxylic-acid synthase [Caldilineales bacterium]|nr:2-succinyl-5-enolpyruvyl-6-hydroxy-3-cyclohexene-1-carboxylic-acid synthase [Caldilineales bacterium]MDW8316550.1 2-succinyl-5-enolpyruvyl-6-hydroxy-3-cyclohexene-1-carboxylic-acid synthase [Anaerolineae bacterium]
MSESPAGFDLNRWMAELAAMLTAGGVADAILSPGSRSAPLTIALAAQPGLRCRVVYDERSAAYIALGLAQQTGRPVALVCTSGTAALNYGPAVAEAFYQGVPLLVFTADRPPEWLDQQDNQAIHQRGLYEPHCRGSYELPVDLSHPDARWFARRVLSEALARAMDPLPGPVHINVPLREPLYPRTPSAVHPLGEAPRPTQRLAAQPTLTDAAWERLTADWQQAQRKLVVAGLHPPDPALKAALSALSRRPDVAVVADVAANLLPDATPLHHADLILHAGPDTLSRLAPDLVISFGGPVVSKSLKAFLRRTRPAALWHVLPAGDAPDTFQGLTHVVPMRPAEFFAGLLARIPSPALCDYASLWRQAEAQAAAVLARCLRDGAFSELHAVHAVMARLPAHSRLQIGNSLAIRYANLIGHAGGGPLLSVNSNRGVSGIDGTVSTAVGAALADDRLTTLITGDLAFFYDRNGLWHPHLPSNLRIVVLNNHGGGIFDVLEGPDRLPQAVRETYFLTPQPLTAQRTAEDHGLAYHCAADAEGLEAALRTFFDPALGPALLEVETDMAVNAQVLRSLVKAASAIVLEPGYAAAPA